MPRHVAIKLGAWAADLAVRGLEEVRMREIELIVGALQSCPTSQSAGDLGRGLVLERSNRRDSGRHLRSGRAATSVRAWLARSPISFAGSTGSPGPPSYPR